MNDFIISGAKMEAAHLDMEEAVLLWLLRRGGPSKFKEVLLRLEGKGLVSANQVTGAGSKLGRTLFTLDVGKSMTELADSLREIFPEGKKPGTNLYWRGSTMEIELKLKSVFASCPDLVSTVLTDENIIGATKAYVDSFHGNYTYMKVLKYFILKNKIIPGAQIEHQSDLLSQIQNSEQTSREEDWSSRLK